LPGLRQKLQITGDFADEAGVKLDASYLNFTSLDPAVVSVDASGTVVGVSAGWSVIAAASHGISAVRAADVFDPTLSEDEGVEVPTILTYPASLAFMPGTGIRQLQAWDGDGLDITQAEDGT
ncbi:hypothetical protein ACC771_08615, partial [Rhizobium ruizarguesonis]